MPFLSKLKLNGTEYDLKTPKTASVSTDADQGLSDTQKANARDNIGLGTAATRSVAASGNANATQVVKGDDTRLTTSYLTGDSASTTINDSDYIPMSDSEGGKKKALWSTIVAKIKSALGITSGGTGFLKKDGTWGTPTNTTYTFATGDNNGQIKVTPSGGSAQNVSVKGLGSAAYDSTVPISHGGTGATTRTGAAAAFCGAENVSSPGYVVGLTDSFVHFGHTSLPQLKTAMGLGNVDNTADSSKSVNYANSAGVASNINTVRTNGDYNTLPGVNKTVIAERSSDSPNRPENQWFYTITMQGGNPNYATQVAYGMTTTNNYTRVYQGGTWGAWKAFRNPTGNATAAQVLSGYTASNASSDGFSGSMPSRAAGSGNATGGGWNGTGAYVYFPYGYYPIDQTVGGVGSAWVYVDQSYVRYMHRHSDTWTPSSSQYNSSQAEIDIIHNARYVNTAVCYSAGKSNYVQNILNIQTYAKVTKPDSTGTMAIYLEHPGSYLIVTNTDATVDISMVYKHKQNLDYFGGLKLVFYRVIAGAVLNVDGPQGTPVMIFFISGSE